METPWAVVFLRNAAEKVGKGTLLGRAFLVEANRVERGQPYSIPLVELAEETLKNE